MERESSNRYAVGVDVGTESVKCVVASLEGSASKPTIVGFGSSPNSGMRKGIVINLNGPAAAIDAALAEVERMSGHEVNVATISVNGAHILSTRTDGMIAVGAADHEISEADLDRIDDVAITGKLPANREVLDLIPYEYKLDGQGGIKDPIGMTGTRLEVSANVISALEPNCQNVDKVAEMAHVSVRGRLVPSVVASARAVLSEKQMENGVAVIDFGATTTGIAIFEEGDVQFVSVVPMGSNNITNDIAMGLKTNPEVAESLKRHRLLATDVLMAEDNQRDPEYDDTGELTDGASNLSGNMEMVTIRYEKEELRFAKADLLEIVGARLDEIFGAVRDELRRAGYDRKLPEGVVLVGGGAKLRGLPGYAKVKLELAAKLGKAVDLSGVSEVIEKPEYAAALGLMLIDMNDGLNGVKEAKADKKTKSGKSHKSGGFHKKLFKKVRS